jgi:hypothetical protein
MDRVGIMEGRQVAKARFSTFAGGVEQVFGVMSGLVFVRERGRHVVPSLSGEGNAPPLPVRRPLPEVG